MNSPPSHIAWKISFRVLTCGPVRGTTAGSRVTTIYTYAIYGYILLYLAVSSLKHMNLLISFLRIRSCAQFRLRLTSLLYLNADISVLRSESRSDGSLNRSIILTRFVLQACYHASLQKAGSLPTHARVRTKPKQWTTKH